jgi:hypothetical protein
MGRVSIQGLVVLHGVESPAEHGRRPPPTIGAGRGHAAGDGGERATEIIDHGELPRCTLSLLLKGDSNFVATLGERPQHGLEVREIGGPQDHEEDAHGWLA